MESIHSTDVAEPGLVARFVRPVGDAPCPAIVAFGGSSGGFGPTVGWAPALAADGFAVLAVAYFGGPGLPPALLEIDVEVVERAVAWLFDRGAVAGDAVAVMGISRGSELALLSSVLLDRVGPVVAFAPSGIVWSALGPDGPIDAPAWTFRGEPIPYVAVAGESAAGEQGGGRLVVLRDFFEVALADPARWADAEIAIEQAKGPILLVSGEDDAMWPSTPMATMVERRAAERGARHRVVHLHYPDAGHTGAGVPDAPGETEVTHPLTGVTYALGGTIDGNAAARADSWPCVVEFLTSELPAASKR